MKRLLGAILVCLAALPCLGADFAMPGGPLPAGLAAVDRQLRADAYDLELLISFGTSNGGSAGHLALAIRDAAGDDDLVYSANFYADRAPEHAADFYTDDLMVRIPKREYLFGTRSSVSPKASFGLDFGEVYKRSLIGVRVAGVPAAEKAALAAYFQRINDDFQARARDTEYHDGEVSYDYLRLNCAKTVGSAFKFGAGYAELPISAPRLPGRTRAVAALNANIPTEMAIKLIEAWAARGYGLDVVLYKKYRGSPYVDPHEEEPVAFRDLPDRFPSVLSRDFRREAGAYEDYDNLYAMYLFFNLGKYSIQINDRTQRLEIERHKHPMAYPEAARQAAESARTDADGYSRHRPFRPKGTRIGEKPDNTHLYHFPAGAE